MKLLDRSFKKSLPLLAIIYLLVIGLLILLTIQFGSSSAPTEEINILLQ